MSAKAWSPDRTGWTIREEWDVLAEYVGVDDPQNASFGRPWMVFVRTIGPMRPNESRLVKLADGACADAALAQALCDGVIRAWREWRAGR